MTTTLPRAALLAALALMPCACRPAPPEGEPPVAAGGGGEAAALADVDGGPVAVPEPGARAQVLVFVAEDCPVANAYAPEVARLHADYSGRGVAFAVVYCTPELSREAARAHAREYGFPCATVYDPGLVLAARYGARVVPEAAVLVGGEVAYLGRIDDRYVDFGRRRENVTRRELRDALEAVLAGRPVAAPRVAAVGCDIPFPERP